MPATLGEYRTLFIEIWGERSPAVEFIDGQISDFAIKSGRGWDYAVAGLVPNTDLEMRAIMLKIMKGRGGKKP